MSVQLSQDRLQHSSPDSSLRDPPPPPSPALFFKSQEGARRTGPMAQASARTKRPLCGWPAGSRPDMRCIGWLGMAKGVCPSTMSTLGCGGPVAEGLRRRADARGWLSWLGTAGVWGLGIPADPQEADPQEADPQEADPQARIVG